MMKLQNDATATYLPGNDEDGYRLINVNHLTSVFSEIHVCDEVIEWWFVFKILALPVFPIIQILYVFVILVVAIV